MGGQTLNVTLISIVYNINITINQGNKMTQIKRVSYAEDFFDTFKEVFNSGRYNGDGMDCADLFRDSEWKVDDEAEYAKNTCDDLTLMSSHDPLFKSFIEEVITCMKYNRRMEEKC